MEFIKAQDLKTVASIVKDLQADVMNSAMSGYSRTQKQHKLTIEDRLINRIERNLTEAGYKVKLTQGKDFDGTPYTYITLVWGE